MGVVHIDRLEASMTRLVVPPSRTDVFALIADLRAERDRADRMAAFLRSDNCYDPSGVLAEHDAARSGLVA